VSEDDGKRNFLINHFLLKILIISVLDVYQEIFGSCSISLHATLEKAKVSEKFICAVQ
jgi:hypothetical protein